MAGFKTNIYITEEDQRDYEEFIDYCKSERRSTGFILIHLWKFFKDNGGLK